MSEERKPISLPTYNLGDEGQPNHFIADTTSENAIEEAKSLVIGDAAFILRSDRKWCYAIMTEKGNKEDVINMRFQMDEERNRKTFPVTSWGKYIRVIRVDEEDLSRLNAEEEKTRQEELERLKTEEERKRQWEEMKDGVHNKFNGFIGTMSEKYEAYQVERIERQKVEAAKPPGPTMMDRMTNLMVFDASKKNEEQQGEVDKTDESREGKSDKKADDAMLADTRDGNDENLEEAATPKPAPTPIKLLETPIKFYKAPTMQEDPAAAALAATSFPDEPMNYHGVIVVATALPSVFGTRGTGVFDNGDEIISMVRTVEAE